MGDLTKNISRHELQCNCECGFDSMDCETIAVVQSCCNHFATLLTVERVELVITSAARCLKYNKSIGSTDASQHTKARAMDIIIRGVDPRDVYDYLCTKYPDKYGIGCYADFTHIDTRSKKARW
jgi:uncharacterized protein YcbK (DUF882 family)